MIILAIDPGITTGIAVRAANGQIATAVCTSTCKACGSEDIHNLTLRCKTCGGMSEAVQLYNMICEPTLEHVVYESFQAQTISKYGLHTVRLVGAIEALCWKLELPVTTHMPVERKPFLDDAAKLLEGRRHMIHEKDALAHLLRFEYDRGLS